MLSSAFQQTGLSATLTTNVAPSTSQSALVTLANLGLTQAPQSLRMINNGTADVWVSITSATATAAFPTPGTTTAGTPTAGLRLKPGVVEVFGLSQLGLNAGGGSSPTGPGSLPGFWVNTISASASQPIDITPGEGV
jgi:hypothetical protein